MNLIDVTNSYATTIRHELLHSPVHFIKVYSLGNSKVVFKKKFDIAEIIISNKVRPITDQEITFVSQKLLGEEANRATVTKTPNLVEVSLEH
ncbi:DUF1827 family protein [Ligilactobacillus sp. Marseille-Q7487]|jgi:hypothetical protein|uniref:DUF1827 family protein n=1 Tax=Ligilactobacillus sp. Marseille-Q7487 TaxID=3022128 RepID=UPI0015B4E339|nr:DUF1827 family protein [Ligilactobacillus sp. Marseille-Q7487]